MPIDKKEEVIKKFASELHVAAKIAENYNPATRMYIEAKLDSSLDFMLRNGALVAAIVKTSGEIAYVTTLRGHQLYGPPTPEAIQTIWPSASLKELRTVLPKDPVAFIKKQYMDERYIFEPHTIFQLIDNGEITGEEGKILLDKYEAYEQQQEKTKQK